MYEYDGVSQDDEGRCGDYLHLDEAPYQKEPPKNALP